MCNGSSRGEHKWHKFNKTTLFCKRCGETKIVISSSPAVYYYPSWWWYPPHYPWWGTWSGTTTGDITTSGTTYTLSSQSTPT